MLKKIIGRNISILYRHQYLYTDLRLKKYHINKIQAEVLLLIRDEGSLSLKEINEFFLFNKATITKIISSLERAEYVISASSTKDKRYKRISITEKGLHLIPNIIEILQDYKEIMIKGLTNDEVEKLSSILATMVENITTNKEEQNG